MWSQAAPPDTEPRGLRPIAGSTLPRPDRRAAPDAQPGARPHATRRSVQPQGVVAVRYLRPRVEGHDRKSHVRGDRLSGLRASAPCQDAAQGGPGALARGQAAGDRCPAAPVSEPGNRCRPPRRAIGPEAVVAVRANAGTSGGPPSRSTRTDGSGLPGVLSSRRGGRRAVGKAVRFGNVDASLAGSLRIPARAEFAGAAAVRSIRRMRTTQEIVQSRDERLRELNDEIKMLDAARVALERREHRPSTRPPATVTSGRKPACRRELSDEARQGRTRREISAEVSTDSARRRRKSARTTSRSASEGERRRPYSAELVEAVLSENGGLSTSALAQKTGGNRDHLLALLPRVGDWRASSENRPTSRDTLARDHRRGPHPGARR